jgi:predicted transcriptional regulator
MKKVLLIEKRKKARELRERGWSIREIAQSLAAGKDSVSKWISMSEGEVFLDSRGCRKGDLRKHNDVEREREYASPHCQDRKTENLSLLKSPF